jgi:CheY-like chemotaxis protein
MEKRTVLFVDDEEKVLASLKRGLLDEPYESLFANSGKEALEILEQSQVHVIVTDMRMPEMGGLELLRTVKEEYPHIIRMVLSGYTQVTTLLTAINQGEIFRFITKPWKLEEDFKPAVREAVEAGKKRIAHFAKNATECNWR